MLEFCYYSESATTRPWPCGLKMPRLANAQAIIVQCTIRRVMLFLDDFSMSCVGGGVCTIKGQCETFGNCAVVRRSSGFQAFAARSFHDFECVIMESL